MKLGIFQAHSDFIQCVMQSLHGIIQPFLPIQNTGVVDELHDQHEETLDVIV